MSNHNLIAIRYDKDKNHFLAVCGFHMNHIMNRIPSRRFRRRTRDWVVPNLRLNCKVIAEYENFFVFEDRESKDVYNKTVNSKVNPNRQPFPKDYDFVFPPKPKQQEALDQLYGQRNCAVFSKAGTGKSKIVVDLNCQYYREQHITGWLIACPNYIRKNWLDELHKHVGVEFDAYIFDTKGWNKTKQREYDRWIKPSKKFKIGIVGLASLKTRDKKAQRPTGRMFPLVEKFMMQGNLAMSVDESHNIKNYQSNTTQNCKDLGFLANWKQIMTGTPVTKDSLDLFGQYDFLDPTILGVDNYYSFRNRYAELGGFENKQVVGLINQEELAELVAPVTFQCTLAEMGAEPKVYMPPRQFELTPEQKKMYNKVRKGRSIVVADDTLATVDNILQVYLALQQIVNGFVTYTEEVEEDGRMVQYRRTQSIVEPMKNPKLLLARDMMGDMDAQGQVIIWSKFNQTINDFITVMGEENCIKYNGECSDEELDQAKDDFLTKRKRFFVATPTKAGTGLNWLVQAEDALYLDNTYKYIDREQTEGRNNRLTSVIPARYWDVFPIGGLVDGVIYQSVQQKKNVALYVEENIERCLADLGIK